MDDMGRVGLTPNDVYGPLQSPLKMRFQEFCQVSATHSVKTCLKSPEYGVRPGCADRVVIGGVGVYWSSDKDASVSDRIAYTRRSYGNRDFPVPGSDVGI